jgi:nitrate/nitrite transport system substrate-binding protein
MKASDFPTLTTDDGFRGPQTHFIDGIVYDENKPNEYITKFAIGLKAGDKI